ncbi:antibiotic biosynthesis monooxygenase family protein [Candidatus Riflebacteria bacterium]
MAVKYNAVRVVILRRVPMDKEADLKPLLIELHSHAIKQPGYSKGQKLRSVDDPEVHLVLSSWRTLEDWNKWLESEERAGIQGQIDDLLGVQTMYQVYYECTKETEEDYSF